MPNAELNIRAFAGDVEDRTALRVFFAAPPTEADRANLLSAVNAWNARPAQATEGLREALYVADEALTAILNYGGEPSIRARRGLEAIAAALAPSKIAPSEPLTALNEDDWQPSNDPAILALAAVAKLFLDAEHHNLDRINVEGPKREGQFAPGIIMSVRVGTLRATLDAIDRAALASTPAPKIAPMVSVKALSWSPNNHHTPDSVWTGELADLRICYAIDPEDRVFRLERGWMMSEAGRDDLGLFPTRAAAEAFANDDWHNKLAPALEPLSQAEGQEPMADIFESLRSANVSRQAAWCPEQVPDLSFRGNELAGETGEVCNVIKKLERERLGWRGSRDTIEHLAEELADVVICADLVAISSGIDLNAAVVAKFNATSEKVGLPHRLTHPAETRSGQSIATPLVEAARMARARLQQYADAANAGTAEAGGRELSRKIWGVFSDFDAIEAGQSIAAPSRAEVEMRKLVEDAAVNCDRAFRGFNGLNAAAYMHGRVQALAEAIRALSPTASRAEVEK